MTMSVGLLDHYNVSTRILKETVQFYENVLGFTNGARPPFTFPGAWLYSDGRPVLHLNDISHTDRQQREELFPGQLEPIKHVKGRTRRKESCVVSDF